MEWTAWRISTQCVSAEGLNAWKTSNLIKGLPAKLSELGAIGRHYLYFPGQENILPFSLEVDLSMHSKHVSYTSILENIVQDKSYPKMYKNVMDNGHPTT